MSISYAFIHSFKTILLVHACMYVHICTTKYVTTIHLYFECSLTSLSLPPPPKPHIATSAHYHMAGRVGGHYIWQYSQKLKS